MTTELRTPLSRERVLRAAVDLADHDGIDGLSMRKLAQSLGVEAMSLYNHVRNKDELLDSIVDVIVDEIEVVPPTADWKASLRQQVIAARDLLASEADTEMREYLKEFGGRSPPEMTAELDEIEKRLA